MSRRRIIGTTVPSSSAICLRIITTRSSRSPPWLTSARGIIPYPNSSSIGSTCSRLVTFGCLISSAATSSLSTSSSILAVSIVPAILLPQTINASPSPKNKMVFKVVRIPSAQSVAPTRYKTFGIPKSCRIMVEPKSESLLPFVTRIPVDNEISRDGIWLTSPSPIVRIAYLLNASVSSSPSFVIPSIIPPTILTTVIKSPATASPFTYFTAPSIDPKKLDSC